jgi:hypothetical protein
MASKTAQRHLHRKIHDASPLGWLTVSNCSLVAKLISEFSISITRVNIIKERDYALSKPTVMHDCIIRLSIHQNMSR